MADETAEGLSPCLPSDFEGASKPELLLELPARLIGMNWPGGFHQLNRELAEAFRGDGPPELGAMAAAARYDTEILGSPLSAQRHACLP